MPHSKTSVTMAFRALKCTRRRKCVAKYVHERHIVSSGQPHFYEWKIFKQLFMIAGFDRYYQIVRCFRDEDLRADRQPEFTQIDIEMSFVGEDDIIEMTEQMMATLFKDVLELEINPPFSRLTYDEAVGRFGLDKPDTRFDLELKDISDIVADSGFKVFSQVVKKGGIVKALNARGCIDFSRKEIDDLTDFVSVYRAKGMAWIKVREQEWQSPIVKFFTDDEKKALAERIGMVPGDLVFFVADQTKVVNESLGNLRNHLGHRLNLIDDNQFKFLWVTRFPMFEFDQTENRYQALHHPFTSPLEEDFSKLKDDPTAVQSRAYDLVLNGFEIGGGSIGFINGKSSKKSSKPWEWTVRPMSPNSDFCSRPWIRVHPLMAELPSDLTGWSCCCAANHPSAMSLPSPKPKKRPAC